jgi:hypothetical protein
MLPFARIGRFNFPHDRFVSGGLTDLMAQQRRLFVMAGFAHRY